MSCGAGDRLVFNCRYNNVTNNSINITIMLFYIVITFRMLVLIIYYKYYKY